MKNYGYDGVGFTDSSDDLYRRFIHWMRNTAPVIAMLLIGLISGAVMHNNMRVCCPGSVIYLSPSDGDRYVQFCTTSDGD